MCLTLDTLSAARLFTASRVHLILLSVGLRQGFKFFLRESIIHPPWLQGAPCLWTQTDARGGRCPPPPYPETPTPSPDRSDTSSVRLPASAPSRTASPSSSSSERPQEEEDGGHLVEVEEEGVRGLLVEEVEEEGVQDLPVEEVEEEGEEPPACQEGEEEGEGFQRG